MTGPGFDHAFGHAQVVLGSDADALSGRTNAPSPGSERLLAPNTQMTKAPLPFGSGALDGTGRRDAAWKMRW